MIPGYPCPHHMCPNSNNKDQSLIDVPTEPNGLVHLQKMLRHVRALPPHFLRLYWFGHLYCWYRDRCSIFQRQPSESHPGPHALRCWIRSWSYDMGFSVRDPTNRPKSHLYWHSDCVRHLPDAYGAGCPLRHFALLPILDGFHWESCACNRWG